MNKSFHQKAIGILGIMAVFLTFLLPIKFGMVAGTPEVAYSVPNTYLTFLIFNWPPTLFSFLSAFLLFGVAVCCPPPSTKSKLSPQILVAFSWFVLFLASLPGIINASTVDFILIQLIHFAGIAAFALAIMRLIQLRPELKEWLINAVIASTILTALMGLSQYFSGFEATKNYVYQQEVNSGEKINPGLQNRLEQTRIFATFSISNSLAAHLVLTLPICIWGILKKASALKTMVGAFGGYAILMVISANLNPVVFFLIIFALLFICLLVITRTTEKNIKYIRPLILIPVIVMLLFVLRHTTSSGGLIAFAASLLFLALLSPIKPKYKIAMVIVLSLLTFPFIFTNLFQKGLSSMHVRFDYFLSALKMFLNHPFVGTGWGDFFHDYTKIKQFPITEAPHTPHSFLLSFTSQAGIMGLFAAAFVLLLPFYLFFSSKPMKNFSWFNVAIITGWCAWALHSFVDFNIQICGTVATAIVLLLMMDFPATEQEAAPPFPMDKKIPSRVLWYVASVPLAIAALVVSFQRLKAESEFAYLSELCQMRYMKPGTPPPPFEKIEQQLKKADNTMPYSPFPWMTAGAAAQRYKEWARSELYYRKAIERSPERASFHYRISVSQIMLGKQDEALKNLEKAARMYPFAYQENWEAARKQIPQTK